MKKVCAFLLLPLCLLAMVGCRRKTTKRITTKPRPTTKTTKTITTKEDPIPIENKTIYVSVDGLVVNDGSSREQATTLARALDLMISGDKIILLSGIYNLNDILTISKSGTSKLVNELIGEDDTFIDFSETKDDSKSMNGGINIIGSYWKIENINVSNSDYFGFTIRGNNCNINNCKSSDNCSGGFYIKNASNTTITNSIASNNSYVGYSASGFYIDGAGTNNVLDSCVSEKNQDSGFVAISSKGVTFNKCLAIGNGLIDLSSQRSGFVFNNKGHSFNNCIAYNNAQSGFFVPMAYQEKGSYDLINCSSINNHSRNYDLRKNINDEVTITNVLSFNNYDSDENGTVDAIKDRVSGKVINSIFFYNDPANSYNYVLENNNYSSSNIDTIVPLDLSSYVSQFIINLTVPEVMKEYIDLDAKAIIDEEAEAAGVEPDYSSLEYNTIYYKDGHIYIYDYLDRSLLFQDELFANEGIEEIVYFGAYVNE